MLAMPLTRRGGSKGKAAGPEAATSGVATLDGPPPDAKVPTEGRSRRRYDPAWDEWKRPHRWPGVAITCVIVLAFISAVVWHYRPHDHARPPQFASSSIHSQPAFVPASSGATVLTFQGKKNASGLRFNSNGGLQIVHAQCECSYNFVVSISDALGNVVVIPVSANGLYNGTSAVSLLKGRYALSVIGEPKWSVQIIQPTTRVPAIATPFRYFSTGYSVIGPFSAANQYLAFRFFQTSPGGSTVNVLDLNGVAVKTPFAGHGLYRSATTIAGLPNPYYLQVSASGYWSLLVRRTAPS